jgi:glycosyltransferase involved in cell wall biosynthesis
MKKLLSIIIPTFNAEKKIQTAIASLLKIKNQDLIEIIIVNDCSTDNTFKVLNNYSDNIKILNLDKNVGCGLARNKGVKIAIGQYISFLDADDIYLLEDLSFFNDLVSKTHSDLYLFRHKIKTDDENINLKFQNNNYELFNIEFKQNPSLIKERPCWSIIYKKNYLLDNKIFFKRSHWEDFDFVLEALCNSIKITNVNLDIIEYNKLSKNTISGKIKNSDDLNLIYDQFDQSYSHIRKYKDSSEKVYNIIVAYNFAKFVHLSKENFYDDNKIKFLEKFVTLIKNHSITNEFFFQQENEGITYNKIENLTFLYYLINNYDFNIFKKAINHKLPIKMLDIFFENTFLKKYLKDNMDCLKYFETNNISNLLNFDTGNLKKIFIHMGLPKTGTSAIQNFLYKERFEMKTHGILYPESITSFNFDRSRKIIFKNNINNFFDHNYLADIQNYPNINHDVFYKKLAAEILENKNCENLILSSENLYFANDKLLFKLKNLFKDLDIKIIFTKRNYYEWLDSYFYEKIYSGRETNGFNYFFKDLLEKNFLPFDKTTLRWKKIFGEENFLEIDYEDKNYIINMLSLFQIPTKIIEKYKYNLVNNIKKSPIKISLISNFNLLNSNLNFYDFINKKISFLKKIEKSQNHNVGFTFINRKIINSDNYNFLENKDVFQNQEFIETVEMTILTNEHRISNFLLPKKNNFIYKLLYSIKKIILSNRYLYAFSLKIISFISLNPKLSGYLYRFIYSIR